MVKKRKVLIISCVSLLITGSLLLAISFTIGIIPVYSMFQMAQYMYIVQVALNFVGLCLSIVIVGLSVKTKKEIVLMTFMFLVVFTMIISFEILSYLLLFTQTPGEQISQILPTISTILMSVALISMLVNAIFAYMTLKKEEEVAIKIK